MKRTNFGGFIFYIKTFIIVIGIIGLFFQLTNDRVIIPVKLLNVERTPIIKENLKKLGALKYGVLEKDLDDFSRSIDISSDVTNIDDRILTLVMYVESRFKKDALSPKGYRGLMQATTRDIFEFAEVDVIRGAKKLEYWIQYRSGNLEHALASYNGGVNPPMESWEYARFIISESNKL